MSLTVWSLTADILRAPEMEIEMTWQYQVRFDLKDAATAESARRDLRHPLLAPLADILANHRAALKCQFDAFAEYVATAEEHGVENYPLYEWTKTTIENPAKKEKYLKSFALYVDGREVYAKEIADALAADLQPLARSGVITRLSKYDTNPANNPQPPKRSEPSQNPCSQAVAPSARLRTRHRSG